MGEAVKKTSAAKKRKPGLSKYLFWDTNLWKAVKYYGKERIRKEVIKCKSLDKKTMNYLSVFYDIPKKDFACYRKDVFQKGF